LARISDELYVVEFFDWLTGHRGWSNMLFSIDDMYKNRWRFYASDEELRDAYEYGGLSAAPHLDDEGKEIELLSNIPRQPAEPKPSDGERS
jgi:hypothetical protein